MAWWWTLRPGRSTSRQRRAGARKSAGRVAGRRRPRCSGTSPTCCAAPPSSPMAVTYRAGVDIGGTFTDIVLLGSDGTVHTKKISSSVENYAQAIVAGLDEVFRESRIAGDVIEEIRHGTTVGSNAILEHKGARTGLITTQGFRDV